MIINRQSRIIFTKESWLCPKNDSNEIDRLLNGTGLFHIRKFPFQR